MKKSQLCFGVIFSNLDDSCQFDIWTGIVDYASLNNIQLTAYVGMYQSTDYDMASHCDTCSESIKENNNLDGVIVFSGFIASAIGNNKLEELIAKIPKRLPVISVSYVLPGVSSVIVDNKEGIYSAVEHLIKAHDRKKIAFVKGPDGHPEAEDRFTGYKNALADNGIKYDEKYVYPGSFSYYSGEQAVKDLFRTPGLTVDSIVACDDTTAIGVLRELKNHNIHVPSEIAVAGFDDDRDSETFIPSISTVRQDFHKIGSLSAKLLLDKINNKYIDEVTYIKPIFMARQSCGCLDIKFMSTEAMLKSNKIKGDSLNSYLTRNLKLLFNYYPMDVQSNRWIFSLIDAIEEKPFSQDKFLHTLNEKLISSGQHSKDMLIWNDAINIFARGIELFGDELENPGTILFTLVLATDLILEIRLKEIKTKELALSDNRIMLRRIASTLVTKFDIDSLLEEMYISLPELGLDAVLIELYKSPIESDDPGADRTIGKVIGFDGNNKINKGTFNSGVALEENKSAIGQFEFENPSDTLLLPLFFKDEEYGVMLMPFYPAISSETYETLRVNISTAVKGASLQ